MATAAMTLPRRAAAAVGRHRAEPSWRNQPEDDERHDQGHRAGEHRLIGWHEGPPVGEARGGRDDRGEGAACDDRLPGDERGAAAEDEQQQGGECLRPIGRQGERRGRCVPEALGDDVAERGPGVAVAGDDAQRARADRDAERADGGEKRREGRPERRAPDRGDPHECRSRAEQRDQRELPLRRLRPQSRPRRGQQGQEEPRRDNRAEPAQAAAKLGLQGRDPLLQVGPAQRISRAWHEPRLPQVPP